MHPYPAGSEGEQNPNLVQSSLLSGLSLYGELFSNIYSTCLVVCIIAAVGVTPEAVRHLCPSVSGGLMLRRGFRVRVRLLYSTDAWKALGSPRTTWREYVPRRGGLLLLASHTKL